MSLKAKIEAVIYAAEEPVTLAQLVGLLGHEAQAELDRVSASQQSLALDQNFADEELPLPAEPNVLNQEVFNQEVFSQEAFNQEAFDPEALDDASHQDDPSFNSNHQVHDNQLQADQVNDHAQVASPGDSTPMPAVSDPAEPSSSATPAATDSIPGLSAGARAEKERGRSLRDYLRTLLDELIRDYATSDRGLEIREVAGGFRLATKPEYHDAVRGFVKALKPPLKLTLQALETLAVVAYKQPVTGPEVSEIRGVDSTGVLGSLLARKLVTTAGRKPVIGRPILYKTTKDFLLRFGLKDINELPSIEEFEKMAGELVDSDPVSNYPVPNHPAPSYTVQEQIPMPQQNFAESPHADPEFARLNQDVQASITGANIEEEKNATEPQADGDGATVETVTPDGRLSGIAPPHDPAADTNTSASEAEIQQGEHKSSQE